MSALELARSMICAVPMDADRNETRGAWLRRTASLFRIPEAIGQRIYYRQKKRVDGDVLLQMHRQFKQLEQAAQRRREGLNELEALARAAASAASNPGQPHGGPGIRPGGAGGG